MQPGLLERKMFNPGPYASPAEPLSEIDLHQVATAHCDPARGSAIHGVKFLSNLATGKFAERTHRNGRSTGNRPLRLTKILREVAHKRIGRALVLCGETRLQKRTQATLRQRQGETKI